MQAVSFISPSSIPYYSSEPLFSSPLLMLIEQQDLPKPDELKNAVKEKIILSKTHLRDRGFLFPALMKQCAQLPPKEGLLLCTRFFVSFSRVAIEDRESVEYRTSCLSAAIAEMTLHFGTKALENCTDCMEIQEVALRIQCLLNCAAAKARLLETLNNLGAEAALPTLFIQAVANARHHSRLVREVITYACNQQNLNVLEALTLTKIYVHFCLTQCDQQHLGQLHEAVAELAFLFGREGIELCQTPHHFEVLADELHDLLDSYRGSREAALQMVHNDGHTTRMSLLRKIFEGRRNTEFLHDLVLAVPDNFFTQEEWDRLGARCNGTPKESSVALWLAVGVNEAHPEIVQASGQQVPTILSPLLACINQENLLSQAEILSAACDELRTCKAYWQQAEFPFPALLKQCYQLSADEALNLCVRFFTPLSACITNQLDEYYIISSALAELAIKLTCEGLSKHTDCLIIQVIAFQVRDLLNLCAGKDAAIQKLSNQESIANPAKQLVFEIARSQPNAPLHDRIVLCACNLRGLTPCQALNLARSYLRPLSPAPIHRDGLMPLGEMVGDLVALFGSIGVERCRDLKEFELLATETHLLLDLFPGSRPRALKQLDFKTSSDRTPILRSIFTGCRGTDFVQRIVLHFADDFFTPNSWDSLAQRCWILGPAYHRQLWLAVAANGSRDDFARHALGMIMTLPPEEFTFVANDPRSSGWLSRLMDRYNKIFI